MKKILPFIFGSLVSFLGFSQNPFCDSVAVATIASDVAFARNSELADSSRNHFIFEVFQAIIDTTPSRTYSQLRVSGIPVTFIDATGTFPDLTKYGNDHHLWDRASIGCPALVQGENGVVIRLRYKPW